MKLKKEFMTHMDGENQMMVDVSAKFSGLVRNNRTAAYIVDCLKTETSESEIVNKMTEKYDASREVIAADVKNMLNTLRSIGAIDE